MNPEDRCPGKLRLNGVKVPMCHTCQRHTYQPCKTEPPARRNCGVWECEAWIANKVPQKLMETIVIRSEN